MKEIEANGEEVGEELKNLVDRVRKIRDDELEQYVTWLDLSEQADYCRLLLTGHSLDHAVENDAKQAEGHALLTGVVRGGCRAAIWVSERI